MPGQNILFQHLPQCAVIHSPGYLASHRQGYVPRLFGHHYYHRVRYFAQADGRPVTGPQGLAQFMVPRQGKEASGLGKLSFLDNDRAVMDGRVWEEDGSENLAGDLGVDLRADLQAVFHFYVPLDNDEGTDVFIRQCHGGGNQLLHQFRYPFLPGFQENVSSQ